LDLPPLLHRRVDISTFQLRVSGRQLIANGGFDHIKQTTADPIRRIDGINAKLSTLMAISAGEHLHISPQEGGDLIDTGAISK